MPDPKPARGPLYVEATPLLVTLDASPLVSANVHDLLNLLQDEFLDAFMELDTADGLAFEELHAKLVARLATKVALTGRQAVTVAAQLDRLGQERSIPGQQDRRAS
ncbi:hypothetical protein [Streptomyces sp. NBC_01233]|uniref:hypothetical protein n=1 Tax=Streptomyces sp. NBC_01233 TaxID=2903787 RepID=UPI002E13FC5B|nr:hypothetical protein OG332_10505 [Streptomyces sp. NBC_01233]